MDNLTRRSFVALGGLAASVPACAYATEADAPTGTTEPVLAELPIPVEEPPAQTSYACDILVVGCGCAGLHAAARAADEGKSVLVIEKGFPGYGGLSSWGGGTAFFEERYGDDREKIKTCMMQSNEYLCNLNWVDAWCDDSRAFWDRVKEWGIVDRYTECHYTEFYKDGVFDGTEAHDDKRGYFQSEEVQANERHPKVAKVLEAKGIPFVDHTMVYDVIEQDGRVVGAMALHVPSAAVLTIKAKAVILATGTGAVKPQGFPTGASSFDGLYIGYKHGLPIAGLEFEDYHLTWPYKPGMVLSTAGYQYLEEIYPYGPNIHADTPDEKLWGSSYLQRANFNSCLAGLGNPNPAQVHDSDEGASYSDFPEDERVGSYGSGESNWGLPGAAPGMPMHLVGGIFCGWDDTHGETGLPGLYAAGDGTLASALGGACYSGLSGITTSGCSIQGDRAAQFACAYVDGVEDTEPEPQLVADLTDEILAPLANEQGFSPAWVNTQLLTVMGAAPSLYLKTEESLRNALAQVEHIRDFYLPRLRAADGHDLRLCRELTYKVTACQIKLRLGLERQESRGMHYRMDYPYRNDDRFLGYVTCTKTEEDPFAMGFAEIPEAFQGDRTKTYVDRYPSYRFPGEAAALGLDVDGNLDELVAGIAVTPSR